MIEGALRVIDVASESPGAEAGVSSGDRIVAVNNEPVGEYSRLEVEKIFQQPGKKLRLSVEREGKRFDTSVKLRRLI